MRILVSGEAGLLGILGPAPEVVQLDGRTKTVSSEVEVIAAFRACSDVQELEVANRGLADLAAQRALQIDRASRLTWMLFDENIRPVQVTDAARALDSLLVRFKAAKVDFEAGLRLEPRPILPEGREAMLQGYPETASLMKRLQAAPEEHLVTTAMGDAAAPPTDVSANTRPGTRIGTVKWFNAQKGFGFIQPDDGGDDVFVHISAVERAGFESLNEGQKISFNMEKDERSGKAAAAPIAEAG